MTRTCTVLSFAVLVASFAFGQQPVPSGGGKLTNQDIIGMVSLGLSDDVVLGKIRVSQNTDFDTSLDGLRALKAAKVSDAVIKQMLQPKADAIAIHPEPDRPTTVTGMPDLIVGAYCGVYYKDQNGGWITINILMPSGRENRGFASKGFLIYRGAEATVHLSGRRPVFFIHSLGSPNPWQILQLGKRGGRRELQVSQETALGVKSGFSEKDIRDTVSKKITDNVSSVAPASDLVDGEYVVTDGVSYFDFGIGK